MYDNSRAMGITVKTELLSRRRKARLSNPRYLAVSRVDSREYERDIYEAMQAGSASQYLENYTEVASVR